MATDLNPMSDQDRISPDKNQYSIKQTKDENKKNQLQDYHLV